VHDAPGVGSSLLRLLKEQHGLDGLTPIHRLDRDASGVLLFARNKAAASAIQAHWDKAEKRYLALCDGVPDPDAVIIDAPILENQTGKPERLERALAYFKKNHPAETLPPIPAPKTSAVHPAGRPAQTEFVVVERFPIAAAIRAGGGYALLEVSPKQGRMHQIRVHLAHFGFPLAVDALYGRRRNLTSRDLWQRGDADLLTRMPLHAAKLTFVNQGQPQSVEAPLPEDFANVLAELRSISRSD
jgi:23S rRNA-/tRNA-specific pseudouridylate synthase